MIVYRLTNSKYKDDLSGYGAYLFGGRWNSQSVYALYAAAHISLAVLEIVVNFDRTASPLKPSYHLLQIDIPEEMAVIDAQNLKKDWQTDEDYTQFIGDHFLAEQSHPVLKIPSVVIPEEFNFLINPSHPDFKKVKLVEQKQYGLDSRLFG